MDDDRLYEQRLQKLNRLRRAGIDPYPARYERTDLAQDVIAGFEADPGREVRVGGRVVGGIRRMGRSTFLHLLDGSGRIQVYCKHDRLGAERFELLEAVEAGDFLGVAGETFRTRTGEVTILATDFMVLAKALRPLPEKWHGLQDVEKRYRQRYLDLIANPEVGQVFQLRSRIVHEVRSFLVERGFLEVETPILQPIAGEARHVRSRRTTRRSTARCT